MQKKYLQKVGGSRRLAEVRVQAGSVADSNHPALRAGKHFEYLSSWPKLSCHLMTNLSLAPA